MSSPPLSQPGRLSERVFQALARIIHEDSGIDLEPSKLALLETRVHPRVLAVGAKGFDHYLEGLLDGAWGIRERQYLVEAIATHETSFFREGHHFSAISRFILENRLGHVRAWSAACSNGAEPYSMAMVLEDFVSNDVIRGFSVLATDISERVLQQAKAAQYPSSLASRIPPLQRQRYLLRSKKRNLVRVTDPIRRRVDFNRLNLTTPLPSSIGVFDFIFCRNVLIYFSIEDQRRVVGQLLNQLKPEGLLLLGHAEGQAARGAPCQPVGPTIYKKTATDKRSTGGQP